MSCCSALRRTDTSCVTYAKPSRPSVSKRLQRTSTSICAPPLQRSCKLRAGCPSACCSRASTLSDVAVIGLIDERLVARIDGLAMTKIVSQREEDSGTHQQRDERQHRLRRHAE